MRVVIVDDLNLVNEGIAALLNKINEVEVAASFLTGQACLNWLHQNQVDLVLLDHQMVDLNGLDTFREIRKKHPFVKVLLLTWVAEASLIQTYIREGVDGYLLKSDSYLELETAVRSIQNKGSYFSPEITRLLSGGCSAKVPQYQQERLKSLTPAELQVLKLIAQGLTTSEIAEERHTAIKTVNRQKQDMMDKLGIHKEIKLMRFAFDCGFS